MRRGDAAECAPVGLDHLPVVVTDAEIFMQGDDDAHVRANLARGGDEFEADLAEVMQMDDVGIDGGQIFDEMFDIGEVLREQEVVERLARTMKDRLVATASKG